MRFVSFAFLLPLIALSTQVPIGPEFRDDLSDQDPASLNTPAEVGTNVHTDVISTVINSEFAKQKLKSFLEVIDFKVRSFNLGTSLLTNENFYLLGRALKYGAWIAEFVSDYLPQRPDDTGFLQRIFPNLPIDQTLYGEDNNNNAEARKTRFSRMPGGAAAGARQAGASEVGKLLKKIEGDFYRIFGNS